MNSTDETNKTDVTEIETPKTEEKTEEKEIESATEDTIEKAEKKPFYKVWYIDLGIAIGILLIVFTIIMMLPANRAKRALNKADKLYAETNYEQAFAYYEKAEKLTENSIKPFLGYALVNLALNDSDKTGKYKEYVTAIENFTEMKEDEYGDFLEFFLLAPESIASEPANKRDILLFAYTLLDKPVELKTAFSDSYFETGVALMETSYPDALVQFDEALRLSHNAESYIPKVRETVCLYLEALKEADSYAAAYELLDKYGELTGINVALVRENLENAEAYYEIKCSLLSSVSNAMKPLYDKYSDSLSKESIEAIEEPLFRLVTENFDSMMQLDGSEAANALVESMTQKNYIYADGGFTEEYTGVAAGLYSIGEGPGYYFYYGDFKNGKREGYGISFAKVGSTSYAVFEGTWKDDAPNGFGVLYDNSRYSYTSLSECVETTYGNWKNGYEDGEMKLIAVLNEHPDTYFVNTFVATEGEVPDVEGLPIYYGIIDETPEGERLILVAPSVTDGYEYIYAIYIDEGSKLGAIGY